MGENIEGRSVRKGEAMSLSLFLFSEGGAIRGRKWRQGEGKGNRWAKGLLYSGGCVAALFLLPGGGNVAAKEGDPGRKRLGLEQVGHFCEQRMW